MGVWPGLGATSILNDCRRQEAFAFAGSVVETANRGLSVAGRPQDDEFGTVPLGCAAQFVEIGARLGRVQQDDETRLRAAQSTRQGLHPDATAEIHDVPAQLAEQQAAQRRPQRIVAAAVARDQGRGGIVTGRRQELYEVPDARFRQTLRAPPDEVVDLAVAMRQGVQCAEHDVLGELAQLHAVAIQVEEQPPGSRSVAHLEEFGEARDQGLVVPPHEKQSEFVDLGSCRRRGHFRGGDRRSQPACRFSDILNAKLPVSPGRSDAT